MDRPATSQCVPLDSAPLSAAEIGIESLTTSPDRSRTIEQVLSAGSPWQGSYIERVIGTLRRDCLDPVIITTKRNCTGPSSCTQGNITNPEHIFRPPRTRRSRAQYSEQGRIVAVPQVGGHGRMRRRPDPSEKQFTSWLGLLLTNEQSGGKILNRRTRKVVNRAATAFRTAATRLVRSQSYLGAQYRRLLRVWGRRRPSPPWPPSSPVCFTG
jgi:hypothetical protein